MMPELEKIADEYKGKVRVMKIDSEEDANLSSLLQVMRRTHIVHPRNVESFPLCF